MNNKINKFLFRIYFFFVTTLLLYIFYRDQIINGGNLIEKYLPYYFVILLLFSIFFLDDKIRTKIIILKFSIYFSLLTCEIVLFVHYNLKYKDFDKRSKYQLVIDSQKKERSAVTIPPTTFLFIKKKELFPIGGISNTLTINCNENGYWSIYKSDRYGFNNPDYVWNKDIDYLLIGDSFLHGSCVSADEAISSIMRKKLKGNHVNLGYGSNGLPIYYMGLRETINFKRVNNIIIFLYLGNDLIEREMKLFLKDKIFLKYRKNLEYVQNIFSKQNLVDQKLNDILNDELIKMQDIQKNIQKTSKTQESKILTLYNLRILINEIFKNKKKEQFRDNYDEFEKFIADIKKLTNKNNLNLHFVVLPDYELLLSKQNYSHIRYQKVLKILNMYEIKHIDIFKEVFSKYPKANLKFFANENSHYNKFGYQLIGEKVSEYFNKK